ncbi:hypothetical protein HPP92_007151 [Vanilla planifolia]|uniref:Uncharacterized protein n=1 Tax=Vanilla planifolia TaxID=51239 RepID=A0A835RHN1_VANPL|nr:hypothetical protein HPP92_007151 [Vanilla planifolia]
MEPTCSWGVGNILPIRYHVNPELWHEKSQVPLKNKLISVLLDGYDAYIPKKLTKRQANIDTGVDRVEQKRKRGRKGKRKGNGRQGFPNSGAGDCSVPSLEITEHSNLLCHAYLIPQPFFTQWRQMSTHACWLLSNLEGATK